MIKNYIKTAFRSLAKNKGFTAINVLGLALGLATCLLIVFYVFDELSYDKYNVKADRIYRINSDIKFAGNENSYATSPAPAAGALKATFPEIEQTARLLDRGGFKVKKGNQDIQELSMIYADSTLFDIFTIPMIHGTAATALKEPNSVVITDEMARKYFNSTDVVGKTLTFNDSLFYKVTGVVKKMPKQSHFTYDFFISMATVEESRQTSWLSNNFVTYILLRPGADPQRLQAKFSQFIRTEAGPQLQSVIHTNFDAFEKAGNYDRFTLSQLKTIHLQSHRVAELGVNGDLDTVYIFSLIAIFILLIACVNFMNLSTARSSNRAREVGVRKVLGSPRKYLIAQFLTESIIVTFAATIIAVVAAWALLPYFNNLANKDLTITPQLITWLVPVLIFIVIFIGCLAGSYPALFLSGFQPIQVLKGKLSSGFKNSLLRSSLVVFQFFISIFLIIGTMVIYNQLKFIQNKDLGYNRDHVLIIKNAWFLGNEDKDFRDELKQLPGVKNASLTGFLPTSMVSSSTTFFKDPIVDQKRAILTNDWPVDENYLPTLGIKLLKGRNFSSEMPTDSAAVIINETAAKMLAFNNPLNQVMYSPNDPLGKTFKQYHIIGIIKDFNYQSLKEQIRPLFLVKGEDMGAVSVSVNTTNLPALVDKVKDKWKSFVPGQEFDYSFMDQEFDNLYRSEQHTATIFVISTSLAIIIACLGLFGLAAYAAEQRTKEIGIRKVLGASMSGIVSMLSKDFLKLVIIAICIASPLAWWAMNFWLRNFAYRQNIQWWVIALAAAAAILIAFITISFQSIKAAITNPVKSLRSE